MNTSLKNASLDWQNLHDQGKKKLDALIQEKQRVDGELAASRAILT